MSSYEERTERHWFVHGRARDQYTRVEDEAAAREALTSWNPSADMVIVYRDVTYGPMVEVDR